MLPWCSLVCAWRPWRAAACPPSVCRVTPSFHHSTRISPPTAPPSLRRWLRASRQSFERRAQSTTSLAEFVPEGLLGQGLTALADDEGQVSARTRCQCLCKHGKNRQRHGDAILFGRELCYAVAKAVVAGVAWCRSQNNLRGFFKGWHRRSCGRRDADNDRVPVPDAHLDLGRAGLLRSADCAGDIGLRDVGGTAGHVSHLWDACLSKVMRYCRRTAARGRQGCPRLARAPACCGAGRW